MGVEVDASAFEAGLDELFGEGKMLAVQEAFTEMVAQDCNEYAPMDTGSLHDTMEYETRGVGDGEVVWPADYAVYVYNGTSRIHRVKTDKNPKASMQWVEKAASEKGGEWQEKLQGMIS